MLLQNLARRVTRLEASPIREILSFASQPGMISFAGGLPAKESFPDIRSLISDKDDLQYGPSEGEEYLRLRIATELQQQGVQTCADRILILSGSQQGIDLVSKLLIEEDRCVAVESPTYLAALQVFKLFGATLIPYDIDCLERSSARTAATLVYANPTFQNPSSRVYTRQERQKLAAHCDNTGAILFEDDPYRDLVYEVCDRQPLCSYIKKSSWVYQSTFSKTIAPGLRLGYLTCSVDLYPYLLRLKQAADLHSCRLSQRIVYQILSDNQASDRMEAIRVSYKQKRDSFDSYLHKHFLDIASWEVPAGGLFFWLQLKSPTLIDTNELLPLAISEGVLFMPGEPFFADGRAASGCFRLNFSNADLADMDVGLGKLARLFKQYIENLS